MLNKQIGFNYNINIKLFIVNIEVSLLLFFLKNFNLFYLDLCMYSEILKKTKTVKAIPKRTNTKAVSKEA